MKHDDGYATVVAIAMMALLGVLAAFAFVVADVVVTRQAATSAADLAALSAASHLLAGGSATDSCLRAQRSAAVSRSEIVLCAVDGTDAVVEVRSALSTYSQRLVRTLGVLDDGHVRATARAGAPPG